MSTSELHESCTKSSTMEGTTPVTVDPIKVFSDFSDATCGEPEIAQHLMLDFTPDPEIDNEISQKKICDFFNFVNNMPDIQNLKVKPTKCEKPSKPSTASVQPNLFKQRTKESVVDMTKTACSMLEVVEKKDLISRAFEGRMPHTMCSLGSYKEKEDIQQKKRPQRGRRKSTKPTPSPLKQLCTKLEQWDAKHPDCSSHLPPSQDSSNPKPMDASSVFADDSCGEPLIAQHVVIDFTPNDGDNDFVQKKVCSFWQFINSHPEIQNLKVKPDKKVYTEDSTTGIPTVSSPAKGKNATKIPDKQALEMLEFAGEKKFVNAALDPKLRQRTCSFGSLDYQQREIITQPKKQGKIKHVCKCIPCRNPSCRNKKPSSVSRDEISPLKAINRMMDKWDAKHPKFVRIWEYVQVVSDMITFALSIICCQCGDAMPLSTSESVNSKPSVQVFDLRALNRRFGPITAEEDPVRSSKEPIKPPHLVIDFPPDKDDHPETQTRCQSIWHCDQNRSGLEDITIVQSPKPPSAGHMIELSKDPVHSGKAKEQSNSHLPAIHNSRTINKKDSLKDSKIGAVNMFY